MKAVYYIWELIDKRKRTKALKRIFASKDVITEIFHCDDDEVAYHAIQHYYGRGNYEFDKFLRTSKKNEDKQKLLDLLLRYCGSSSDRLSATHLYEIICFLRFNDWATIYILDHHISPDNSDAVFLELLQILIQDYNIQEEQYIGILNKLICRIKDKESLQSVADSTENVFIRAALLEGLGFEEAAAILYLDHKYNTYRFKQYSNKDRYLLEKHANETLVTKIQNQQKLIGLALNDDNKFIRIEALKKVQDPEVIEQVAKEDSDQDVVLTAMELSRKPEIIAWIALHTDVASGSETWYTVSQAIDMLDDQTLLRKVFDYWQGRYTEEKSRPVSQYSNDRRDIFWYIKNTFQHICRKCGHDYGKHCVCRICDAEEHTFSYPTCFGKEQKETCTRCGAVQIHGTKEVEYTCLECGGTGEAIRYSSLSGEGGSWTESCSCGGNPLTKEENYRYITYAD